MNKELNIIRAYAKDSLEYGNRTGNIKAKKRGEEVLFALSKIEESLKEVQHLNDLIVANQRTLLHVENDFTRRIDPGNYDNIEEWKIGCTKLREEINA